MIYGSVYSETFSGANDSGYQLGNYTGTAICGDEAFLDTVYCPDVL